MTPKFYKKRPNTSDSYIINNQTSNKRINDSKLSSSQKFIYALRNSSKGISQSLNNIDFLTN